MSDNKGTADSKGKGTAGSTGTADNKGPSDNYFWTFMGYGQAAVEGVGSVVSATAGVVKSAANAADRVVRSAQVRNLTPEQIEKIKLLYDEGDVRKDNRMDKVELRVALHRLTGHWLTQEEMTELWKEIDIDRSGGISFDEFLNHVGPIMYPPAAYQLMRRAAEAAGEVQEMATARIEEQAYRAADPVVDLILSRVQVAVRQSVVDVDMPKVVQRAAARLVDSAIADLKIEVKEMARAAVRTLPPEPQPKQYKSIVYKALRYARGWFLYTLFPYDRTVWAQVKDPAFVVLKIVSVFPYYGVQPIFFIIQFCLMDHWDEYQLVHFILLFKGSQFISIGLISTLLGAWFYYAADGNCSAINWRVDSFLGYVSTFLFIAQIVVVWLAFLFLPVSKEKGRQPPDSIAKDEIEDADKIGECFGLKLYKGRGGRLRAFLIWDTIIFAVVAAAVLAVFFTQPPNEQNIDLRGVGQASSRLDETVYWGKTIYGLLSFPFMFFQIPVVGALFTHTLPTAYTRWGDTVATLDSNLMQRKAEQRRIDREVRMHERMLKFGKYTARSVASDNDNDSTDAKKGETSPGQVAVKVQSV